MAEESHLLNGPTIVTEKASELFSDDVTRYDAIAAGDGRKGNAVSIAKLMEVGDAKMMYAQN
jgi:hypothetical protein